MTATIHRLFQQAAPSAPREQERSAVEWNLLASEYHQEIRRAADVVGRKVVAIDLGVDLSTVSNWLACEAGRGFPPPRLLIYLRAKVPALAIWENTRAGYLPPEKPDTITDGEWRRRIEARFAANPDAARGFLEGAFGPGQR